MSIKMQKEINALKARVATLEQAVKELSERKKPGPKPKVVANG